MKAGKKCSPSSAGAVYNWNEILVLISAHLVVTYRVVPVQVIISSQNRKIIIQPSRIYKSAASLLICQTARDSKGHVTVCVNKAEFNSFPGDVGPFCPLGAITVTRCYPNLHLQEWGLLWQKQPRNETLSTTVDAQFPGVGTAEIGRSGRWWWQISISSSSDLK